MTTDGNEWYKEWRLVTTVITDDKKWQQVKASDNDGHFG